MNIDFRSEIPARDQFWKLFQTTGWNEKYKLSADKLVQALHSSWYVLSAYEGEQLIGFGRLVSDGILHVMIYELIVLSEYRNRGIGGKILEKLVEKCREAGVRDIQLFCAAGKREFYERRGFVARPEDAPGMQYVRQGG
jgi:GNAT superfamily N-acetyltransferase